jgi:hypothetical protein
VTNLLSAVIMYGRKGYRRIRVSSGSQAQQTGQVR